MKGISEKIQQIRREISRRQEFYRGVLWRESGGSLDQMVLETKAWLESIDALIAGLEESEIDNIGGDLGIKIDPIDPQAIEAFARKVDEERAKDADPDDGWVRNPPENPQFLESLGVLVNLKGGFLRKALEPSSVEWGRVGVWQVTEAHGWRRVAGGKIHAKDGELCDVVSKSGHLYLSVPYGAYTPPNEHIHAIRFHK